jgi:hypothetical protein
VNRTRSFRAWNRFFAPYFVMVLPNLIPGGAESQPGTSNSLKIKT